MAGPGAGGGRAGSVGLVGGAGEVGGRGVAAAVVAGAGGVRAEGGIPAGVPLHTVIVVGVLWGVMQASMCV